MPKFHVFILPMNSRGYRGSIWDVPMKPWIPEGSEHVASFNINEQLQFKVISDEELQEINKIKKERKND